VEDGKCLHDRGVSGRTAAGSRRTSRDAARCSGTLAPATSGSRFTSGADVTWDLDGSVILRPTVAR
jgi:hypothetical protein